MQAPLYLQDAKNLLTNDGFETKDLWYHGTSSALLTSIREQGLKRSGDHAINQAVKSTMAAIGNNYTETIEPVFLTQSKELAYYWAVQAVRDRSVRFEGKEEPVVLAVKLPQEQRTSVRPDVGARSLLLIEGGEDFITHLTGLYQRYGYSGPDIDLVQAGRSEFQDKLGMVYLDQDVSADCVELVAEH
jgi:hypothetical protein